MITIIEPPANISTVKLLQRASPSNPPQQIHVRAPQSYAQHSHRSTRRQRRSRRQLRQPNVQRHRLRLRSRRFPWCTQGRPRKQATLPCRRDISFSNCPGGCQQRLGDLCTGRSCWCYRTSCAWHERYETQSGHLQDVARIEEK